MKMDLKKKYGTEMLEKSEHRRMTIANRIVNISERECIHIDKWSGVVHP